MDEPALRTRVQEIMRTVLRLPQLPADARRQTLPEWDSLRHVELMLALEDAFGVEFSGDELTALDSVEAIVAALMERGHAA